MPKFLFQPDPIVGYEFYPIPINIHLEVINFDVNNTDTVIVENERQE
ncbi:MAG TPA: hypothetical protein VFG45_09855 [Candidatus Nitrosocosmicus sp.]|nr:hypothetical protein [Candidatus Nitrosocosmicus sp.]